MLEIIKVCDTKNSALFSAWKTWFLEEPFPHSQLNQA